MPGRAFNTTAMSKCILRVAKINNAGSATGKTSHNYRLAHVPNADPVRTPFNKEYINNGEKNIWELANERIEEAGIKGVRKDAVRGMEFLMTASPDAFKRDQNGISTEDLRNSKWVNDNLKFLSEKYGKNLVAFTLHQDEKTPHMHAIVVPITHDGRLSAKELFNPNSLKKLQTEYAQAMSAYGLERGIEGSRARHVDMKHIYGTQQQSQQELKQDLKAINEVNQPLIIDKPSTLDLLTLERWRQDQIAKINIEHSRQLEEVKKAAEKAQKIAVANATASEQAKILQQKLNTSEGIKDANFKKAQTTEETLSSKQKQLEKVAVLIEQGRLNPKWSQDLAQKVEKRVLPQMEEDVVTCLKRPTHEYREVLERLGKKGYTLIAGKDSNKAQYLEHTDSSVRVDINQTKFRGLTLREGVDKAIERTRQEELAKSQKRGRGLSM